MRVVIADDGRCYARGSRGCSRTPASKSSAAAVTPTRCRRWSRLVVATQSSTSACRPDAATTASSPRSSSADGTHGQASWCVHTTSNRAARHGCSRSTRTRRLPAVSVAGGMPILPLWGAGGCQAHAPQSSRDSVDLLHPLVQAVPPGAQTPVVVPRRRVLALRQRHRPVPVGLDVGPQFSLQIVAVLLRLL